MVSQRAARHEWAWIVGLALSIIMFIVCVTFNGMGGAGTPGVFQSTTANVSLKYVLEITPAGWTFTIWGVIYAWQVLWFLWAIAAVFRQGIDEKPLYLSPRLIHPLFFTAYILNMGLNTGWMLLWDREYLGAALFFIALMSITLFICLFLSAWTLNKYLFTLYDNDMTLDVWLFRHIILNGIACYATWVTIATLLNFGSLLAYRSSMSNTDASTFMLSLLAAQLVAWSALDALVLDRYLRYVYSPYCVVVWALSGCLAQNYVTGQRNAIYLAVLLAVGGFLLLVKIGIMIYRHFVKPLLTVHVDTDKKEDQTKIKDTDFNSRFTRTSSSLSENGKLPGETNNGYI